MDLDVVDVFQFDAMAHGNGQGIASEMREIRRMVIQAADTATGQNRFIGLDSSAALAVAGDDAQAAVLVGDDVDHSRKIAVISLPVISSWNKIRGREWQPSRV